jgi:hypothetical protein
MIKRPLILAVLLSTVAFGQGHCQYGYGTAACPLTRELATAPIKPVFASTGWRTVALDHITFLTPNYRREAAYHNALWAGHSFAITVRKPCLILPTGGRLYSSKRPVFTRWRSVTYVG